MSDFPSTSLPPQPPQSQPQAPTGFQSAPEPQYSEYKPKSKKGLFLALGITASIILVLGLTGFFVYRYYTQASYRPTTLSEREMQVLETKIEAVENSEAPMVAGSSRELDQATINSGDQPPLSEAELARIAELEEMERRTITLTEREINGMMNYNTGLGERIKVKFKNGYVDVGWIIPVDEEAPFIGGKTLRGSVDMSMEKLVDGKLAFAVEDVSVMGIPMPNAWLGDIKGQNLIDQFGDDNRFFAIFSAGIEDIEIRNGEVRIRLAQ